MSGRLAPLPIDPHLPRVVEALRSHRAFVLVAPPGSGKTTRVPPAILEGLPAQGKLLLLQPRRIAARASAARIAEERGWTLGREVGYQVRFESMTSRETRIEVITEGILTRRLQGDPLLEGVSVVLLDEFHERSLHADLAIALLREIQTTVRDDLHLGVLSATLDPGPVSRFLGDAPVIEVEGAPFPLEVIHVAAPAGRAFPDERAARALEEEWSRSCGHALVFLPGIGEIRRTARRLEGFASARSALITPLHGSLTLQEQDRALRPSARRKIILATNIAETSITIDGVDLVIDLGLARILRQDPRHGVNRLELTRISKHSASQRAGRAARQGPGRAVRLWTHAEHASLAEAEAPEIRRVDLASLVLELRAWGATEREAFRWFEAPEPGGWERAEQLLAQLHAIDGPRGAITPAGRAILSVPAHPRMGRLLLEGARRGVLEEAAAIAALIEEREIVAPVSFGAPGAPGAPGVERRGADSPEPAPEAGPSDLLVRLDLLCEAERRGLRGDACRALGLDPNAVRAVERVRRALLEDGREAFKAELGRKGRLPPGGDEAEEALLRALLHAYPDRVARRRRKGASRGLLVGGRGVILARESVVQDSELFLAIDAEEGSGPSARADVLVRAASAVKRSWIEEDFPEAIDVLTSVVFDERLQRARATEAYTYLDLPLEEPRERPATPREAAPLLAQAAREHGEALFLADEAAGAWLARARALREWMPELGLPSLDAEGLGRLLEAAALDAVAGGSTSLADIVSRNLLGLLHDSLDHALRQAVERHAPESIRVPSGNHVRLQYAPTPGRPPILAVRLQELFGLAETPTIAGGRVPVLLHLLGPNHRPVQVTQDLNSFWNTTYAQVRKDLRARYPRHSWPEDPWTAPPQARPGRRKKG